VDAVLVVAFVLIELWGVVTTTNAQLVGESAESRDPVTTLLVLWVVATHVPLLWRQRRPLFALVGSMLIALAGTLVFDRTVTQGWGILAAVYEYALVVSWRRALLVTTVFYLASLAGAYRSLAVNDLLAATRPYQLFASVLFLSFNWYIPWALGVGVRRLRQVGERQQVERAQLAVEQERVRVARELHDILSHSISLMVLQAAGAREVLAAQPARAAEALAAIEQTGRQSLVEVRRLLGVLRGVEDAPPLSPQPGLDDIGELVLQVRDAGLRVHVAMAGERQPLDPSVDLTAYRIIQESLTNVVKHAGEATVGVLLDYRRPGVLQLEIVDDGRGPTMDAPGGNGLMGMHERAMLVGGHLEAGPRPEGGFRVTASLPLATSSLLQAS